MEAESTNIALSFHPEHTSLYCLNYVTTLLVIFVWFRGQHPFSSDVPKKVQNTNQLSEPTQTLPISITYWKKKSSYANSRKPKLKQCKDCLLYTSRCV